MDRNKQMLVNCYLTVNSRGAVRVTKTRPAIGYDEVTIGLSLSLPTALFEKPQLSAVLVIPPDAAMPAELPVDVVANVRDAIATSTGMSVQLSVVSPDEEV